MTWRDRAACRGWPTDWWFAKRYTLEHHRAVDICETCPVKAECRRAAIRDGDSGLRGGVTTRDRVCDFCCGTFPVGNSRRSFCSPECRAAARGLDMAGGGTGSYSGGCRCADCREGARTRRARYRKASA